MGFDFDSKVLLDERLYHGDSYCQLVGFGKDSKFVEVLNDEVGDFVHLIAPEHDFGFPDWVFVLGLCVVGHLGAVNEAQGGPERKFLDAAIDRRCDFVCC